MANSFINISDVVRRAQVILHQKANFLGSINRQYDDRYAKNGAKIGSSLQIRLPNQYSVTTGATLGSQDIEDQSVTLTVATQKHVPINFTTAERTMNIDDFAQRHLEPAMAVLVASVEADALSMYQDVYQQVNAHGSALTFKNVLEGRKKLNDSLAPQDGMRTALVNTQDNIDLVDALKGVFHDSSEVSKQYKNGFMGTTGGFDFMENTLIPSHTVGSQDGAYLVNDTVASGDSTVTVDTGTGTLKAGDVITFAGVNSVHPESKADTGVLKQFVVTADYAGGAGTISVSPSFISTGAQQNISALPADNAAITVAGTASTAHGISMGYHRDAFAFATADLIVPGGTDMAAREVYDGISLRAITDYDINNDKMPTRIDILYGYQTIRPQLAVRYAAN